MAETTFYQNASGTVNITNARAILDGKTYAMSNITSVNMGIISANRALPIVILIVSGLAAIFSLLNNSAGAFVLFAAVCGLTYFYYRSLKDKFIVKLGSSSGESDGMSSTNKEEIQKICAALNESIVSRG